MENRNYKFAVTVSVSFLISVRSNLLTCMSARMYAMNLGQFNTGIASSFHPQTIVEIVFKSEDIADIQYFRADKFRAGLLPKL